MVSEQDRLSSLIAGGSLFAIMASFFGFGLLLAFTPCVLPMIPILSGIIAGQGEAATPRRSFLLSVTYVLGMALTYTIAGAAFAAAGQQAQAFFQHPWIIITFAALFVVLALAMFGLFDLKIPAALETRLAGVSGRQKSGSFVGTAIMGALSALVVTACVAPPMVAALAVIGQTGRRPARRACALRHGHRHGRAAAARRRRGRPFPAACRALDDDGQGLVRRAVPRRGGLDARAHPAGFPDAGAVGAARHRRRLLLRRLRPRRAPAAKPGGWSPAASGSPPSSGASS